MFCLETGTAKKQAKFKPRRKDSTNDLKCDRSILLTKANKGNSIVVLNKNQRNYQNQVTTTMEERKTTETVYKRITYKRLSPTAKTELELEKV